MQYVSKILSYCKKQIIWLIVILFCMIIITILSLTIKSKVNIIREMKLDKLKQEVKIKESNDIMLVALDANATLKLKLVNTIRVTDSTIKVLKLKLKNNAKDIYNPAVISDDSITMFISDYIHNKR